MAEEENRYLSEEKIKEIISNYNPRTNGTNSFSKKDLENLLNRSNDLEKISRILRNGYYSEEPKDYKIKEGGSVSLVNCFVHFIRAEYYPIFSKLMHRLNPKEYSETNEYGESNGE